MQWNYQRFLHLWMYYFFCARSYEDKTPLLTTKYSELIRKTLIFKEH